MKTTKELFDEYTRHSKAAEYAKKELIRILEKDVRLFNVSKYFDKIHPSLEGFEYIGGTIDKDANLELYKEFFKYEEFPNTDLGDVPF